MRFNRQILWALLIAILLPWAGCQYLGELQGALREGQRQALQIAAASAATALPGYGVLNSSTDTTAYALRNRSTVVIDARDDDWRASDLGDGAVRLSTDGERLYLYISVDDELVVWPARGQTASGDHLELRIGGDRGGTRWRLAASGNGRMFAYAQANLIDFSIRGAARQTAAGYDVELSVPLPVSGTRVQIIRHDYDDSTSPVSEHFLLPRGPGSAQLVYNELRWDLALEQLAATDVALRLYTTQGWLVGFGYRESNSDDSVPWWWRSFASWAFGEDQVASTVQALSGENRARDAQFDRAAQGELANANLKLRTPLLTHVAYAPVISDGRVVAVVAAAQDDRRTTAVALRAFGQMLLWSFGSVLLVVLILYFSRVRVSMRVKRLRRAMANAVNDQGIVSQQAVARLSMPDYGEELGPIAETAAQILDRQRVSSEYLETLAGKLTHELRTPLTVVRSSLEHLERFAADGGQTYLQRAKEGLARLESMLRRMREARAVEQSVRGSERVPFDLAELLNNATVAYAASFPDRKFMRVIPGSRQAMLGMPELIRQMLDKLIENAVDFCSPDGEITVALTRTKSGHRITVSNDGPLLPKTSQSRLFEAMVSMREQQGATEPHFGLGLRIVQLIVAGHHGRVFGRNREDRGGVEFIVELPLEG